MGTEEESVVVIDTGAKMQFYEIFVILGTKQSNFHGILLMKK